MKKTLPFNSYVYVGGLNPKSGDLKGHFAAFRRWQGHV